MHVFLPSTSGRVYPDVASITPLWSEYHNNSGKKAAKTFEIILEMEKEKKEKKNSKEDAFETFQKRNV
jgi:hypothetical protein